MCIAGSLKDFSLPEICRLIENGKQTGLLTLRTCCPNQDSPERVHYIWVYCGRIVAVTNRLDAQGLVSLMAQCQWIDRCHVSKLVQLCPLNQPLGLCLIEKGALQVEQLKWLFQVQVLQPIRALFQLQDAQFEFESNVPIPMPEMTGLSISATAATLMGLNVDQN